MYYTRGKPNWWATAKDVTMNKQRRKELDALQARYSTLIAQLGELGAQFESFKGELESIRDEEQEYYDNLPSAFQDSEKGEKAQASVTAIEDAIALVEAITEFCETSDTEAGEFESAITTAKEGE